MKKLLLFSFLLTGCITAQDIAPPFDHPDKINETNYMNTPCFVSGVTVKKKPKVKGFTEELNTSKRKE